MFSVSEVMAASCAAHRVNGFVKKNSFSDSKPNSRLLYDHFYGDIKLEVTDADREQSVEVIEYLKGLTFKAFERKLTDFEENVLKLVTAESVDNKSLGIAASLPKVYENKCEQDTWEDRERELAETSEFVGELRKRCDFELVIENVRYIKTTGASLYCCSEGGKNIVKFFADGNVYGEVGDTIHLAGYVKSQVVNERFSGGKETMINRIKDLTA